MSESSFMHGWMSFLGSFTIILLVLTAFGIMLGIVKPDDTVRSIAAIVGVVIALMLAPSILAGVWSAMSLWKRFGLAAIAFAIWHLRWPVRESRKK